MAIEHDRSDLHNGHQCVVKLTFDEGLTVYYKPRPGGCETAFGSMVEWVNEGHPQFPLAAMDVLDRGEYCWVREVIHSPCFGTDEAKAYYHRAGMLLALMYALQGRDVHNENVIASGANPYLIDAESLLEPEFAVANRTPELTGAGFRQPSVFDIGMLPCLFPDPSGSAVDISGLRGVAEGHELDATGETGARVPPHRPFADGVPLELARHVDDLVAGFREVYHRVLAARGILAAAGGKFDAFRGCAVRMIFRHTASYAALIDLSLSPRHLQNGIARSLELHVIGKPLADAEALADQWPALRSELRAARGAGRSVFFRECG